MSKPMVCIDCGMRITADARQAKRHGWEVWVGGARCKRCRPGPATGPPLRDGARMTRAAYEKIIEENLEWLSRQPQSLEREHIALMLKLSPDREYGPKHDTPAGSTGGG